MSLHFAGHRGRLPPQCNSAAGGPTVTAAEVIAVTGRSRRRAYELLRAARTQDAEEPAP